MIVVWSKVAIEDLVHLRSYIAKHNPTAAGETAQAILDAVDRLRRFPASGRPGRLPHTRELVVSGTPFIIPYTARSDRIEIIAVLHGARKWP